MLRKNLEIIILAFTIVRQMRPYFLIAIFIFISIQAFCRKIPGTIISNGKSREVTFDIKVTLFGGEPNFQRIQYKLKYYDEAGKKHTLHPDDADEIRFEYEGMNVRMISCTNTMGDENIFSSSTRIFLKLEIDGPLRLYRYYFTQHSPGHYGGAGGYSPGTTYTVDNLIFQKGNGLLKRPRVIGWKKDMLEYFSDCPALSEKLENKDLRRQEIEAIVLYYNEHCGKK